MKEESRRIRKFLLTVIIDLGTRAVPEAIKYLGDSRWFVKRNMLYILSECGGSEALPHVKPYCYHDNPKVRFQALRYLFNTDKHYGIEVLKNSLHAGEREIFEMALTISGAFRVKEVVPDLIALLKKMAKRGSDFDHKIPIVKALGQIGDPRALETLNHILASKSLLYKGPLQRLKDEISLTLKHYPGNKDTR
jgi:HEAT repeat protein